MFIAKHGIKTDWSNAREQGVEIGLIMSLDRSVDHVVELRKNHRAVAQIDLMLLLKFATPYSRD